MKKWKAIVAIGLVFVLGMLAGGLVTAALVHSHVRHVLERGPDAIAGIVVHRLDHDLRLDSGQREKLRKIVDGTRVELRTIRRDVQPRVMQVLDVAQKKVREILGPDQAKQFDELVARGRARWEHE
jgi:hypothetical protein